MTAANECPVCGERRKGANLYTCKPCKQMLDAEVGKGWEHTEWWKAIQASHDRLLRAEELERKLLAALNEGAVVSARRTLFDKAVELIRSGVLDETELTVKLVAGRRSYNRAHLRRVVARALEYTADEVPLIRAREAEYPLQMG